MERHRAGRTANAMAFDLFLAFLPMLALAGWALTHFVASGPELLEASSLLADLTPDQLREIIRTHFESLSAATLAPVAAVSGWWLASSAFHTMIGVFEEAFDCPRRPWWRSRLLALGYALAGMAVFMLSGVLGVTLSTPPGLVGELLVSLRAHGLVRPAFLLTGLAVMTAFFALLYGVAIRRPGVRRRIWPGAFTAASLGGSASFLLGYYAGQVARFALFYGSLAAVAILLLWLWVWCAAILLGAELNVLLENRGAAPRPRPEASGSRQC
jgi:membrane protein